MILFGLSVCLENARKAPRVNNRELEPTPHPSRSGKGVGLSFPYLPCVAALEHQKGKRQFSYSLPASGGVGVGSFWLPRIGAGGPLKPFALAFPIRLQPVPTTDGFVPSLESRRNTGAMPKQSAEEAVSTERRSRANAEAAPGESPLTAKQPAPIGAGCVDGRGRLCRGRATGLRRFCHAQPPICPHPAGCGF